MKDDVTIAQQTGTANSLSREQQKKVRKGSANSTIKSVIAAIRLDAADDPLSFLLRSDTGHDGE